MKLFDTIILWIEYGSAVLKTVSKAMGAVRDNWPTMPGSDTMDNVRKEVSEPGNHKPVKEEVGV